MDVVFLAFGLSAPVLLNESAMWLVVLLLLLTDGCY